jgi:predicted permease
VNVLPLYEHIYGKKTAPALWLITAVAICVLLIAVTNIANLLLARLEARDREFAVRIALGAGHGRLARQILGEIGLLAALGAALGIAIAYAALRIVIDLFSARMPRLDHAALDPTMLGLSVAISIAACLAAALAPIFQIRRDMFGDAIRRRASTPLKRTFTVAQISLATALLASAGLLLRSFSLVEHTKLGYKPDHLLVFELVTRAANLNTDTERDAHAARVARESLDRIQNLPGVIGAANAGDFFLQRNPDWQIYPEGRGAKPVDSPLADDIVTRSFFHVMGAPILAGRVFTPEEERDPKRSAVVINEAMARKFWPGIDPVGKRFSTSPPGSDPHWHIVIGVAGNMQMAGPESAPIPQMYFPTADYPDLKFVIRTASDPNQVLAAIRREIHSIDAASVVFRPTTVEARMDQWTSPRRMNASVVAIFALLAATLAGIGVFSLLHYATSIRTREFGVRMALGATPANLLASVVRDGIRLAAIGAIVGAIAAIAAARTFQALLFEVQPWDPATIAACLAGAIALAAAASLFPAIRAAKLNPSDALRQ